MEFFYKHSLPLLLFILQLLCFISIAQVLNSNVTALLVFGDSTVDPGNNNNLRTIFKANFPPYGREFANQTPTGRFSDGQLTTDFVASYLGIKKYVPPYLDPSLSIQEMVTGVSFASGGSGYDPLTPTLSVSATLSLRLGKII
nr:gdsl esterase/lipase [Quercus suber]